MSGTVGGVACDIVAGDGQQKMTRGDVWQVAGLDGYGAMDLGLGDGRGQFRLVKFGLIAALRTWAGLIEALKGGDPVTIVNDFATTYSDFEILEVSAPQFTPAEPYNVQAVMVISGVLT